MPKSGETNARTTQRLEAFSDAVFAIAITLLVLEIKVPELHPAGGGVTSLGSALLGLWTSYFAYVFSFMTIGIFWANHHYNFQFLYERTDHSFILLNLLYLMCISFLPFPTAVLARYIADGQWQHTAIVFYAVGLFLPTLAWLFAWLYGSRRGGGLLKENLDERFVRRLTLRYVMSCVLFFSAILLALWSGIAGLGLCIGLILIHLFPVAHVVAARSPTTES